MFLLALVPVSSAWGDANYRYPRLGLYGHAQGNGWPIIGPGGAIDGDLHATIARYHEVILPATPFTEYRPDVLQGLRAMHPGIKLYAYVQANYCWYAAQPDSNVHLPTRHYKLVKDMNGWLYNQQGAQFADCNINLAKKSGSRYVVAEALADYFASAIVATGRWDGIFFDRYCQSIMWMETPAQHIDYVRAGYPTLAAFDVAWRAGTDTLASRLRRNVGGTPVLIGNCGQGTQYASFNGWMRENFPYQNGGTWETNMYRVPGGYLTDEAAFRSPHSNWLVSWVLDGADPYSSESARRARYTLGTAALSEGLGTFNPSNLDLTTDYMRWWYDEYAVDLATGRSSAELEDTGWLGRALGPTYKMFWVGHEYDAAENPGFEIDLSKWALTTSVGATMTRDATTAGAGLASVRVNLPQAGVGATSTRLTTSGKGVPMLSLTTYSATFWARAQAPRSITVAATNKFTGALFAAKTITIDATWRRYQVELQSLDFGLAQLEFQVGGSATTVWFDDAHLQMGATSIHRRDFENGIVLVNPSAQVSVVLEQPYRRILGTVDPTVNDGYTLNETIVGGADALFLIKPTGLPVGVEPRPLGRTSTMPAWTALTPNPAFAGQSVRGTLETKRPGAASVDVFDAAGRHVRKLFAGELPAGSHTFVWDGRDGSGRAAAGGIYFLRASLDGAHATRKVVRA